ncbi:T-cell-specific surface glycoprotein CD28 [Anguilla anguilla]|uniref:T-cell-specific surface glycoprotein CD28 n=1 Tax=Anguilla anguilla TaxID=7936 RepID=UPI0015B15667|nr:T-cell-specific surface glycoprotein CD28 [Anguilla anguilla]
MIPALITLISLCTHAGRALRVQQPYRVEARDGEARLRCSYAVRGSPEEMRLTLYRGKFGDDLVCQRTFNTTQSHFQTDGPVVRCRGELTPGGVDLAVSGLRGEDTDIYRCQLEVLYPPPYLMKYGNGTIVYIPEKTDCPTPASQAQDEPQSTQVVLPIAVMAIFIIIFIIAIISIYMFFNTSQRKRMYPHMTPVTSNRVDCRFGYENFL